MQDVLGYMVCSCFSGNFDCDNRRNCRIVRGELCAEHSGRPYGGCQLGISVLIVHLCSFGIECAIQ